MNGVETTETCVRTRRSALFPPMEPVTPQVANIWECAAQVRGADAGVAGTRQRRAARTTRAIQRRSAPRR